MKMYNHAHEELKRKIYTGRNHTKKVRRSAKKKSKRVKIQKDQSTISSPVKKARSKYKFDPWWLPSNDLLKASLGPSSIPISIGNGATVFRKGGAQS